MNPYATAHREPDSQPRKGIDRRTLAYALAAPVLMASGKTPKGKLGRELTTQQGYELARSAGLDILAAVQLALGTLDRVARVVKLQGFLNATEDFEQHPKVLDGCSDLMVDVFGPRGVHARSVLGAVSLRGGAPLVIESLFEVAAE